MVHLIRYFFANMTTGSAIACTLAALFLIFWLIVYIVEMCIIYEKEIKRGIRDTALRIAERFESMDMDAEDDPDRLPEGCEWIEPTAWRKSCVKKTERRM